MRPLVRDGGIRTREYPTNRVKPTATPAERINHYAREDANGCWIWTAHIDTFTGYGKITIRGKVYNAHKVSYETFIGPVPAGLHLDHLCRVRECCNPAHLEPVTPLENVARSPFTRSAIPACPRGHEYNEANTYRNSGRRYCRPCQNAYSRLWMASTAEERAARKAAGLPAVDLDAYFAEQERAA